MGRRLRYDSVSPNLCVTNNCKHQPCRKALLDFARAAPIDFEALTCKARASLPVPDHGLACHYRGHCGSCCWTTAFEFELASS